MKAPAQIAITEMTGNGCTCIKSPEYSRESEKNRSSEEVAQNPVVTHYKVMLQISLLRPNLCQESPHPIGTNSNFSILGFYP